MIDKDKIFEILGVEAGESFYIEEGESFYIEEEILKDEHIYHFDIDFNLWHNPRQLGATISTEYSLLDFLNGKCHIKKIKTMTPSEKIVLEYAKLCGGKYIAKDEDGDTCFYSHLPTKDRVQKMWILKNSDDIYELLFCPFSLCSWEDEEPLCIEEVLASYKVKGE